jgi:hypothetical protein
MIVGRSRVAERVVAEVVDVLNEGFHLVATDADARGPTWAVSLPPRGDILGPERPGKNNSVERA